MPEQKRPMNHATGDGEEYAFYPMQLPNGKTGYVAFTAEQYAKYPDLDTDAGLRERVVAEEIASGEIVLPESPGMSA